MRADWNNHSFQTSEATRLYSATRELWDTPVFESDSFVVVPTVGALVEGWLLVVPRRRTLCYARLPAAMFSELKHFLDEIVPIVEESYGPISLFEHGPSATGSPVGCGTDYAHLHLVPVKCDLRMGAAQITSNIRWNKIGSFEEVRDRVADGAGYWFLQQPYGSGECNIGSCSDAEPISQLFRKVIATSLGTPEAFDWKEDLGADRIAATVETLAQHIRT